MQIYTFICIYAKKVVILWRFMDRKALNHILRWTVALLACGFLLWKIATYDDYASLWSSLTSMETRHWLALLLCLALMPVNMSLEAWRWKTLVPMSWSDAHRQVYYSKLAGLITPWRLGEYPARGMMMQDDSESVHDDGIWGKVLSMGAVGSATMTAAIVLAGVAGIAFSPAVLTMLGDSYLYALVGVVLVLAVLYAIAPQALKKYAEVNYLLLVRSTFQSLVRLGCWCVQLALVLYALGALSTFNFQLSTFPIYYLLVTITPNVPVVEAGVRGAWAIFVFGSMNAALAGVLLWGINTLLPCVVGLFFRKNKK